MSMYKGLFASQSDKLDGAVKHDSNAMPNSKTVKANLFGEEKKNDATTTQDIQDWLTGKNLKTTANRINFILNGIQASKITSGQISDIGHFHAGEAAEANRYVDKAVNEFAELKPHLEQPKQLVLEAVSLIEGGDKPQGFLGFLRKPEVVDVAKVRKQVQEKANNAMRLMKNCVQYRIEPFLSDLDEAKRYIDQISTGLDNTINALNYVIDKVADPLIQDLARRRKEMFAKSLSLMQLNMGQLNSMASVCEKNKAFATELEVNVLPVIENVMRAAIINDVNGGATLQDISTKLKGIV